jgi:hypothetical protein
MRKSASVINAGTAVSLEFSMEDWDTIIVHAKSPTAVGILNLEESLDGGTTWIAVNTPATAIGVPLRISQTNISALVRFRFSAGHGTETRVYRKRTG